MKMTPNAGQALVELAIFGSLGLMALTFLIQMGLRLNYQQELQQQTFRRALLMAKCEGDGFKPLVECVKRVPGVSDDEESQATVLNQFRDRQMPIPRWASASGRAPPRPPAPPSPGASG